MNETQPDYIPLLMVRPYMNDIPIYTLPDGFRIRTFKRGDQHNWARIEALAGEFSDQDQALREFEDEFGDVLDQMEERCFLLEDSQGQAIGTATAWMGELDGQQDWGRVHWVGIVPDYQGRKLAKPLLSAVMQHLAQEHTHAYLTTTTKSYQAINMYLNFGFVPQLVAEDDADHWYAMAETLDRRIAIGRP